MCGIVGYVGKKAALPILMNGLRRLEYRGYDSAGVAIVGESLRIVRSVGKIQSLDDRLFGEKMIGFMGIAHTRWATHGVPSEANAHPHTDCRGNIALVHNGIIENYRELKEQLESAGHAFRSETDTEALVHLIEHLLKYPGTTLADAVRSAVRRVRGTYGIAVVRAEEPGRVVVARLGSPIVIGVGGGELFVASDANAIIGHTRRVIFLDDGEMAVLGLDGYQISSLDNLPIAKEPEDLEWTAEAAQKNGYPHFMMKEMSEQPEVLRNTMRGRLNAKNGNAVLGGLRDVADQAREIDRLIVVGCGSAYYAAQVGEYMLEEYAGIPVEVELASEFRYRKPIITSRTAVIAVSQSGETADTLAAIREAKMKGALTLGIVNAVGSTIARETDAGVYSHAGPEIGVASTKAYLSQVTVFALLTLFFGRQRQMSLSTGKRIAKELVRLPELVTSLLERTNEYRAVAQRYAWAEDFLYMGRKYCAPAAFEGALKLKELSYVHAEGYAAGEMKHGPIALIDEGFPSMVLCPVDSVYEKTKSNVEEIRARRGKVIAITTEGNNEMSRLADDVLYLPKTLEMLVPVLMAVPLQLFAYHAAVLRGFDPDMPRNLAKSVTVE
ncbi:glutamine--fructose-6-phosphate aminotransferase [Candidatus Uhrbacteria bacterium RIFOXYB12_FULL_58_10]|uniref:Glutamine--fructose-6-phosphate aminotransferase [isomerizing] n=1 Tax=Candidatus Uhrbacteria bacterium RIFOXYB2_FULL_57_15 TaxID=1802422 RepID=A0A1F7W526_9BACT|nr:MAG: glutamine--fructose-6-phosphate aminotransferase [Candidatus Uhrbacteria bacterium RIFOXYB12_FULL_58_10]OGL97859.1 MAG: glutamine--fructose-6-phosphate aminotransferase [Candidatus Uhrbacteria bacterium RIFOXYB2_FULL_57_15]OGM00500.1 MAG: glutamine--fructose-6-phosphate aminotransferase [Candidatus Uhrbacteria bacterium RIFOXYC12_FULL_57_11]